MGSGIVCVFGCGRFNVGNVVDDCYFDVGVWCSKVVEIESDC